MAGTIPQQFIDELLDRVDIVDVVDARVKLRKAGKDYSARCPFHDEKSPSFTVIPDKQFYYCFGCGASGNAIGFLMNYERLEFPEAVEKLAAQLGLEVPREGGQQPGSDSRSKARYDMLARVDRWYREQLRQHPAAAEAVEYLRRRGLSGATARDYGIGFAPPGWENLTRALGARQEDAALLLDLGLLIRKEGGGRHDRFRHRVMFPIRDVRGRTIAFGGRVLGDDKPKYMNSPESAVFHKGRELYGLYEARQAGLDDAPALVVEGYMDAVMLAQYGIREAVATLGTALTPAHLDRLFRYTSAVIICFDGDAAGRRAADRALQTLLPALQDGRDVRFLFLPEGEDPDSLVQRVGADGFRERAAAATPVAERLFARLGEAFDLATLSGRAALARKALPMIGRVPGAVTRSLLLDQLAERTGVRREELQELAEGAARDAQRGGSRPAPAPRPAKPRRTEGRSAVEQAMALLLHAPEMAAAVPEDARIDALDDPHAALLADLVEQFRADPTLSLAAVIGYWAGREEGELLGRLAAREPPGEPTVRAAEFGELIERFRQRVRAGAAEPRLQELARIPFEQLSAEQKSEYLDLLREKRGDL
jgi:DNA primase